MDEKSIDQIINENKKYIIECFFSTLNSTPPQNSLPGDNFMKNNIQMNDIIYFCCELKEFINTLHISDKIKTLSSFRGDENEITDNEFIDIISDILIEIIILHKTLSEILDKYFKKLSTNEPNHVVISFNNNMAVKIANPICVLSQHTPMNTFYCDNNKIFPQMISQFEQTNKLFRNYFDLIRNNKFDEQIKNLVLLDREIIKFTRTTEFEKMENDEKNGTKITIVELFKSQIEFLMKLLCTMRTKIYVYKTNKQTQNLATRPRFWLPARTASSIISGDNSIANRLLYNVFGNYYTASKPRGGNINVHRKNIKKIIYKQYKYLYLIHKYMSTNIYY
jgi:hypothetical protein